MNKLKKSQILIVTISALLLVVTPFLSPSFRSAHLYFVTNFLIVALGTEAGLLSAFSKPLEDKKPSLSFSQNTLILTAEKGTPMSATTGGSGLKTTEDYLRKKPKVVEKSAFEKIVGVAEMDKVKRCPSLPTLFFIGGGEAEADEVQDENEEEVGGLNRQELFAKSETFIGNFYKQLNMQKEDSWNGIHGF